LPASPACTYRTHLPDGGFVARFCGSIPRSEFLAALFIIGCTNGITPRIIESVARSGWTDAVVSTFGISVVVWVACAVGIRLVLKDCGDHPNKVDLLLGAVFLFICALPGGGASWLAVTALCLYVLASRAPSSSRRRGAVILLSLTVPTLWSALFFRCFSETILKIDAYLVSQLLGSTQIGNLVRFADGAGELVILAPCSSIANLSLLGHNEPSGSPSLDIEGPALVLFGGCGRCSNECYANEPDGVERAKLSDCA
jgi:hypothetical protein